MRNLPDIVFLWTNIPPSETLQMRNPALPMMKTATWRNCRVLRMFHPNRPLQGRYLRILLQISAQLTLRQFPLTARRLLLPNRQILMLARRAWTYLPAILRQPPIPLILPRLPMHQREKKPLQAEGAIQVDLPLLTRRTKPNVPILWIPAPAFSTLTPAPMPPLSP
ncbi:hypothetical protein IMSAG025_01933 [Muribaculaceae bacterium]|nr:hypothetical protein IMSAG025_01933 [Muribaculaceae bacterium]